MVDPNLGFDPQVLGVRLQEERKARNITQQGAAAVLGLSLSAYTATEKGERPIQPGELIRLAEIYGRSVHALLWQPPSWYRPDLEEPTLSPEYVSLAVGAYEAEELTEGELMEVLRTDRLRARQLVEEVKKQTEVSALAILGG